MALVRIAALRVGEPESPAYKVRPAYAFVGRQDTIRFRNLTGVGITVVMGPGSYNLEPCQFATIDVDSLTGVTAHCPNPPRAWRIAYDVIIPNASLPPSHTVTLPGGRTLLGISIQGESTPEIVIDE